MATTNSKIDLVDLDKNNTNTDTNTKLNKYIERQEQKVLNINQNTTTTTATSIFSNSFDKIIEDAVPIFWGVLFIILQQQRTKK